MPPVFHLDLPDGGMSQVDLSDRPETSVHVTPSGPVNNGTNVMPQPVRLSDRVNKVVIEVQEARQVGLALQGGSEYLKVTVRSATPLEEGAKSGARLVLHLDAAQVLDVNGLACELSPLGQSQGAIRHVSCRNADLTLALVASNVVELSGRCHVKASRTAAINNLQLHPESHVLVDQGDARISELVGPPANFDHTLKPETAARILSGSRLVVDKATDGAFSLARGSELHISRGGALRVRGPGSIHLNRADIVDFEDPAPLLSVEPYGQVFAASGNVHLASVADAHIFGVGGSSGLKIASVAPDQVSLERVSISNVEIPVSSLGLQTLSALTEFATSVSPTLSDDMPGRGKWRGRKSLRGAPALMPDELQLQAEYAYQIADLAAAKGASAAIRTDLAWAAYRMRNAAAPGKVEKTALFLYRSIGYGERAGPPFLLYVAVCVSLAWLSVIDQGLNLWPSGWMNFLHAVGDWLMTPVHLLRLSPEAPDDFALKQPWDTLARVAAAVPFTTAVLAARNYVKEDHRNSP
jgi:hypothetical protein